MGKSALKNALVFLLALLCIAGVIFSVFALKMRPVVLNYAQSRAESIFVKSANDAVAQILTDKDFNYNSVVNLTRAENGFVTSLEIDTAKVNYFKSIITNKISENVDKNDFYTLKIPSGTFLCTEYFNGVGPDFTFKMKLTSTATVDFKSEFTAAGINQVLHKILIKIKINGSLITAGTKRSLSAETTVIAAQTVIVGAVPDSYTQVIENEGNDTAGLINDYGGAGG